MGKWTSEYHDDVLRSKVKRLVQGAIQRSKLEEGQPTISYETFVQDLDEGDSFTASMIETMVKELADRRARTKEADRRMICDSTSKALRTLASTTPIHRSRTIPRYSSRRSINLTEYLALPPDHMTMDDEDQNDDFAPMQNRPSPPGGLRELYDAYWDWGARRLSRSQTGSASGEQQTGEPVENNAADEHSPGEESFSTWLPPPPEMLRSPPPFLSRQGPIRRPTHSRRLDFNDFTSRRRLELRRAAAGSSTSAADDAPGAHVPTPVIPSQGLPLPRSDSTPTRRLEVHLPSWRHVAADEPAPSSTLTEEPATISDNTHTSDRFLSPVSSLIAASHTLDRRPQSPPTEASSRNAEHRHRWEISRAVAPRLRRGGVRAPESLLTTTMRSVHAVPFDGTRSRSESP
ncbi:hypothetical protein GLOTRDRAFT_109571 [Gloeophyllum trabeum ATCC 11539]|uniref:Uncharacterized protein n=1 Tax=Gloeophyllum trabeum (strain ATCC 11539 / FP-39264 / Madison 617) TaxID=670483 RepID=S7S0E2_GLOTA|nr:uncharacterized protein GLOTRDRAFT_109571 [Gloeophyllum trabeum ATCC 11539]EPQ59184.1 hypothetical protein GLOTRDRAFT_109571 [Gloeophyllum trabeum ATCC 11539]